MLLEKLVRTELNISKDLKSKYTKRTLRKILSSFNFMSGDSYFMIDYFQRELIIDSPNSRVLCGYPMEQAIRDGFSFFNTITLKEDLIQQGLVRDAIANIYFSLEDEDRYNLLFLYDINVQMKSGEKRLIHYKLAPFQLCDSGNLWLALGCVSHSIAYDSKFDICVLHSTTSTRYKLFEHQLVPTQINIVMEEEKVLLHLMVKNMLESDICKVLKVSKSTYHRMKNELFTKLEVDTPAAAVQRAHHLGLI